MADHLLANKFSNLSVGFFCSEWFGTLEIVNCFKNLVSTSFVKAQHMKELLELSVSLSWKKNVFASTVCFVLLPYPTNRALRCNNRSLTSFTGQ